MDTSITTEADLPVSTCSKRSILAHHNKAAATSLTSSIANTASSSLSNSSNAFVSGKMESEMMAEEQAGMVMLSTTSVKPSESSGNGERDDDSKLTAAGLSLNKPHIHAAIQWMQATYVASPAHNISREEIYQDYVKFATEQNMEVMNMATFGKVTRVVFPDIKTRRLGVRGNSRYNYMGVRARVEGEMGDGVPNPTDNVVGRNVESEVVASPAKPKKKRSPTKKQPKAAEAQKASLLDQQITPFPVLGVPELPAPATRHVTSELDLTRLHVLSREYRNYLVELCAAINDRHAEQIQDVCDRFWKHLPLEIVETIEEPLGMHYVWDCDINFYSAMLNVTFGEAMAQIDPVALEQLASVATHFVGWTKQAIVGLPVSFAERKIQLAQGFTQALQRSLALNQTIGKARSILSNNDTVTAMLAELKRTDLESINETLAFTCNWQAEFPRKLEADIHSNLKRRVTVEQWTVWLNDLVRKGVNFPMLHEPCNVVYVEKSAKLFIGQFSYFTSQLMRDIAMRGAPVTAAFQALTQFLNEYVWFITVKNVSILKLRHFGNAVGFPYPGWVNGIFYFHVEQYGSIAQSSRMNRSAAVHPVARALTTAVPPVSMIADPIQRDMLMLPSLPSLPSNGDLTMMAAARQNASLESVRYHTIPIHQQQPQKLPEEVIPEADAAETTTRTLGETKQDGASTASLSHLINWK